MVEIPIADAWLVCRLSVAGTGIPGNGANNVAATAHALRSPRCVAVDANDTVWICDSSNHMIKRVPTKGPGAGLITTFAGSGVAGTADGRGTAATLNNPRALTFGTANDVYW